MRPPQMIVPTAAMLSGIAFAVKVLPDAFFSAWKATCCSLSVFAPPANIGRTITTENARSGVTTLRGSEHARGLGKGKAISLGARIDPSLAVQALKLSAALHTCATQRPREHGLRHTSA
eukprot:CAMPEP_0115840748 /NCGR_PEP_ID=MMETSP0287-20121206/6931_1 /TAXON_ID=412157 /ORGANISM="Chrysochromulina rotalis, Strain UIO044" /LENGTH=118 /DNA_ID=CAMNT_0003294369 /DNA_START=478 /DNA_END=830 /DNA_ORIENTATION=-